MPPQDNIHDPHHAPDRTYDYTVHDDGQPVGRIRYASERTPGIWIWNVTVNIPGPPIGTASSIDDAKDRFKTAWDTFKAKHGEAALSKAYEAMNHANRSDRYR